jgi:hypothetical protein
VDTDYYTAAVAAAAWEGCTSSTTQSENPSAPASFLLYTNKNAGVEMNYPSDWQLTGNPAVGTIARFQHENDIILFEIQRTAPNRTGQTVQSLASNYISAIQKSNGSAMENHSASLGGLPSYRLQLRSRQVASHINR